jgi:dTMP kinase
MISELEPKESQENVELNQLSFPQKSEFLSVLKIKNFMIFSLSQAVSLFGDKLNYMALLAMIAYFSERLEWQSSRALSYLSITIALPTILLGPIAGAFVDRWNRLKVLIVCDFGRAVLVSIIPLVALKTANLTFVYLIIFVVFLLGLFFNTSRMSIIPNLVARRRLLSANAFINFIGRIATFLGMVVGGLLVDWQLWSKVGIRPSWSAGFYLDGLSYLISVLALGFIALRSPLVTQINKKTLQEFKPEIISVARGQVKNFLNEILLALRFIKSSPFVLLVFASIMIMVLMGAGTFILLIPYIQAPTIKMGLGWGTKGVSIVLAAGAVGLVISSMVYGILGHRINKYYLLPVSFIIMALIIMIMPFTNRFWIITPLAFLTGLFLSPVFIAQDTILQEIVPSEIRGKIFSAREWVLHLTFAGCSVLIGELSVYLNRQVFLLIIGIGAILSNALLLSFIQRSYQKK